MTSPATLGSVVIAAHEEESVILQTLRPIVPLVAEGLEVVVVANGCSDRTAELARSLPGVTVVELDEASKTSALNAGDLQARGWPRLYLDADVSITAGAVLAVLARLRRGDLLAARPAYRYLTEDCSRVVRSYYRARSRMPAMAEHLWGAGAYALAEHGHARLGRFPALIADDLHVDQLFSRAEVAVLATEPVLVRCPREAAVLVRTLRRVYRGRAEIAARQPVAAVGGLRPLLRTVRSLTDLVDAVVYAAVALVARLGARRSGAVWQRDTTSRGQQGVAEVVTS